MLAQKPSEDSFHLWCVLSWLHVLTFGRGHRAYYFNYF